MTGPHLTPEREAESRCAAYLKSSPRMSALARCSRIGRYPFEGLLYCSQHARALHSRAARREP